MPVEDWIEKWTDMCVREMNQLAETQKRSADALAANQQRMEDRHEARMEKIETSIEEVKTQNAEEFKKVYDKLDQVYTKLDDFIKASNEKSTQRDNEHAISLTQLKTQLGIIAAAVSLVASAFVSWLFGLIKV